MSDEALAEITCDKQAAVGLGIALEHMAAMAPENESTTRFHSARIVPGNIRDYVLRFHAFMRCSDECFVLAFAYIDRLVKRVPHLEFSHRSSHRLIACSLVLAAKFHDETFYTSSVYARIAGLSREELNRLENTMLEWLDHRLFVHPAEFAVYRGILYDVAGQVGH